MIADHCRAGIIGTGAWRVPIYVQIQSRDKLESLDFSRTGFIIWNILSVIFSSSEFKSK